MGLSLLAAPAERRACGFSNAGKANRESAESGCFEEGELVGSTAMDTGGGEPCTEGCLGAQRQGPPEGQPQGGRQPQKATPSVPGLVGVYRQSDGQTHCGYAARTQTVTPQSLLGCL